ncbi:MAG: FG-GAP-like repeat-containing protein [Planctomycetota bacterium]
MAPQFVEFSGDRHLDIVTATFDGSAHVAFGSEGGFLAPEHILDSKGHRVLLAQYWDYERKDWLENAKQPKGHCTSAVAFDWDGDGDLDLLLGSYGDGQLYRQMNEGKAGAPQFTGVNLPISAGGQPLRVAGGITTPQLVDWNGDGLTDILCGGFGDSYGDGPGGGVWVYLNCGAAKSPSFDAPITLIPTSPKGAKQPTRPDSALYAHAVDYDADGDLDLIVGGYSHWSPPARSLSEAEQTRVLELQRQIEGVEERVAKLYAAVEKGLEAATPEAQSAAIDKLFESPEFLEAQAELQRLHAELDGLVPSDKREAFVWYYERSTASQSTTKTTGTF